MATTDALLLDALTQLPELGGYEALANELGQMYPDASFAPRAQGLTAQNWEPTGLAGQLFPLTPESVSAGYAQPSKQASYDALLPALTNLVQRGIGKMEQYNPTSSTDTLYTGMLTDDRGKEQQAGVGQGVKGMQHKVGESSAEEAALQARLAEINRGQRPPQTGDIRDLSAPSDFSRQLPRNVEGGIPNAPPDQPNLEGDRLTIAQPSPPWSDRPLTRHTLSPSAGPLPEVGGLFPGGTQPLVQPPPPTRTRRPDWRDAITYEPKGASADLAPPVGAELTAQVTPGGGTTRTIDRRDYQGARGANDPVVSDPRDAGDIENNLDDQQKNDLNNIKNEVNTYLNNVGWSDSGDWGYARTRNLLTGGGLGSVVTQGPMVPWQSMGGDASSADYISNVGGRDIMPSRLAPGERLGETTASGELSYVPEGQREGWKQPIMINQVHPGTGGGAGEPGSPMNQHLEDLSGDISFKDIPGGLTDIPTISLKTQAGINDIRANADINTLRKADSVEGIANILSGGKAVASKIVETFTNLLGISDSDVKGEGFWTKMTTPIEAVSTKEFGITPLDIALVVAGGAPAIGTILMGKLANAMFKPVTSLFTEGLSGMFDAIFSGNKVELGASTESDAGQKAVSDMQSMLKGLGQNAYSINKGTLYGPSGNVLGSNMQPVTFDAAGNSTFAGDIRIGPNDTVLWSDPSNGGTGKIWINGKDTGKVAIKDNNGELKLGDSETSGASVPTKKEGPTTSVPVVGVSTISTVISGPGSRRKDEEEEEKKDKG